MVRIGLISDTHMPQRWPELPARVAEVFAGVQLILHAGDLGELWVLDHLSTIAPVIAVHGNDETPDAKSQLPYQQVLAVAGVRILLCHSHHPDRAAEQASRRSDDWLPKLRRHTAQAAGAGATVYVFGHFHVPLSRELDGVLLVNPGAIASGSVLTRQKVQSVALLEIDGKRQPRVRHVRVDDAEDKAVPRIDWGAGFRAALSQVSGPIVGPDVEAALRRAYVAGFPEEEKLEEAVLRVARRCWAGQQERMDQAALLAEARALDMSDEALETLRALLQTRPHN